MSIEETEAMVARAVEGVVPLAKAKLVGGELGESMSVDDERHTAFDQLGALEPPYDPHMLCLLFEHSNSLRQNVDAYATNIDAFGHTFDPMIDLDADDVRERVAAGMPGTPTDSELDARFKQLQVDMKTEEIQLRALFASITEEESFVSLRKRTRQDLEVVGNGYWEILRNKAREVAQFVYVPAYTMRLLPICSKAVEVGINRRVSDTEIRKLSVRKRFRTFVQHVDGRFVYFKEYGDPRTLSSKTGRFYDTPMALDEEEKGTAPATEILHFRIPSPRSPYGVPRWIGQLLGVMGSRQVEEVNFLYFENKSVPPLAILVSGGRIAQDSVTKIEDYVKNNLRGRQNFHKILIIEAEPSQGTASNETSSRMKIELKPLLGAQHSDALFQNYDEKNMDKVGQAFRLPRMLRGDIRDFNRSTAIAAKHFAEEQVFQPEREDFDWNINTKILLPMGFRLLKFRSLAPVTRDPQVMSETVKNLMNAGAITPAEGRLLASDIFNVEFRRIDEPWTKQPIQLTLAGIGLEPGEGGPEDGAAVASAKQVLRLRDMLKRAETAALSQEFAEAKAGYDGRGLDE